ncbi:uncharacterized protein PV09_06643 [Verruconis gallopava]|uniref:GPI mannosyltransferase 2 n=1 Tax=Verruconis gallopava TaxID=253628 RepID=A0A0D2ASL4_9PEZI|nr:uncharacterized protein PV09_06643 [Verruconis gallopava]KIW02159.1 hypothetical protein PV09_06643 [Verruconis gallopava]
MVSITVDKAPRTLLVACFLAWKALLLTIAIISPQPGYDTSTRLLFKGHGIRNVEVSSPDVYSPPGTHAPAQGLPDLVMRLLLALTRWDTIYFASIAERGYVYEQEWAFGWGFLKFLSFLGTNIPLTTEKLYNVLIHGIILANVSHLISIILLFQLALALQTSASNGKVYFAFICAALHIFTPAGIFLVAPCPEALFSLLSFAGYLLYVYSWIDTGLQYHGPIQDLYLILSGFCFGLAATVRGNGLLSGIIYFYDALIWLIVSAERLVRIRVFNISALRPELHAQLSSIRQRRLPATVTAGMLVGIGFAGPQYIAFQQFCGSHILEKRPWCHAFPPSIYSWVQSHYWNVGFLSLLSCQTYNEHAFLHPETKSEAPDQDRNAKGLQDNMDFDINRAFE